VAATEASSSPNEVIQTVRNTYRRRCDVLVERFGRAGWQVPSPSATMSAWGPIPEQFRSLGSLQFSKLLLQEANVAVSPGEDFGEYGEGYVRIALVKKEQRILRAARNIKRFLSSDNYVIDKLNQKAS